jgi:hypothetical protein
LAPRVGLEPTTCGLTERRSLHHFPVLHQIRADRIYVLTGNALEVQEA